MLNAMKRHPVFAALLLCGLFSLATPAMADPLYIMGGGGGGGGGTGAGDMGGGGGGAYVGNTSAAGGNGGTPVPTAGSVGQGGLGGGGSASSPVPGRDGAQNGTGGSGTGTGAGTGSSSVGANGGSGGDANVVSSQAGYDSITMRAGSGGASSSGGSSGRGGDVSFRSTASSLTIEGNLEVHSGFGGQSSTSTATSGGRGGNASFITAGDVIVNNGNVIFAAETGGSGLGTGSGGAGGLLTVGIGGRLTVRTGTLVVDSGGGGNGAGNPGVGNSATFTVGSLDIAGNADFRGSLADQVGASGDLTVQLTDPASKNVFRSNLTVRGIKGYQAGRGGSVYWNNPDSDVQVLGAYSLTAGNGHATGTGVGGNVVFAANTLELGGNGTISSGNAGGGGAAGGNTTFSANTVKVVNGATANVAVTAGNSGAVNFAAGTAEATDGTLNLTFSGTDNTAGDDVRIGTLLLGNGGSMGLSASGADSLRLTGGMTVLAYDFANPDTLLASTYTGTGTAATNFSGKSLRFVFPQGVANGDILLNAPNPLTVDNGTNVSLGMVGNAPLRLVAGDEVVLISSIAGTHTSTPAIAQGGSYKYNFTVKDDAARLIATFDGMGPDHAATRSFLTGKTATSVLVAGGSDLLVNGLGELAFAAPLCLDGSRRSLNADGTGYADCPPQEPLTFAKVQGGHTSYSEGVRTSSDELHAIAGIGARFNHKASRTIAAAFAEAGRNSFDTRESDGTATYKGSGDGEYYGGGLMARHDLDNGLYGEVSARMGRAKTEYTAKWASADLDSWSTYYGLHGGVGYVLGLNEKNSLDLHARLLWTRVESDNVDNSLSEHYALDDFTSTRSRVGATWRYELSSNVTAFAGADWEYEFDGKAKGKMDGFTIPELSYKGHSGLVKMGVDCKATDNLSFGFSGHGVFGQREGGGAEVSIGYSF